MLGAFRKYLYKDEPGPIFPVNMFEEIKNFKRVHGKSPVIIINLTCLPFYADHSEETIFGGRHDIYRQMVEDFFHKLKEAGAILEFFNIVKPSIQLKHQEFKMPKFQQMAIILDEIYKGISVKEALAFTDNQPIYTNHLHLRVMKNNLPKIAKQNGGIFKAWDHDTFHFKMAELALKLNAFAIITDQMRTFFFNVPFRFWYGRYINFEDCTTNELNRESILKELGLRPSHLPILGAFFGGQLHRNVFKMDFISDFERRFKLLVELIKCLSEKLNRKEIQEISKLYISPIYRDEFAASYDHFSLNREWEEPQEKIERFLFFENTSDNYLIVAGYDSVYDVEFFDHRKQDFAKFIELRLSLVQRKAGILLKHKNNPDLRHSYFSRKIHLADLERSSFVPVYPKITVPSLDELLCPSDYPELNDVRYDLLCWTIDEKIKKSEILKFNSNYIVDVLALYCGLKYEFIKPFEAMVILMTINTVINGRIPDQLTYPTHVNERAMRLSFVYLSLYAEIVDIIQAVGLVDLVPITTRFDGIFYHKLYNVWMNIPKDELNMIFEGYPQLQEILKFFK